MRVTLIHNPGAGVPGGGEIARLLAVLRDAGHSVRYQSSKDDGWDRVLDEAAELVAVAGGDGTVARVAKRMLDRSTPVAPLPAGTANNIARTLGLAGLPVEDIVRGWREPRSVKLDIGKATGPWGTRRFVEAVGLGLFACAVPRADASRTIRSLERADAKVAYALQLLKDDLEACTPVAIEATLDGADVSGEFVMFEAMILPYVGPNLHLAPDTRPGDGQMEVVMVRDAERDRLHEILASWQNEKPRVAVLPSRRGRRLSFAWTGYPMHIDDRIWPAPGEDFPAPPGRIELSIEGAVDFLVPQAKPK